MVVLSGPPVQDRAGRVLREDSTENTARIRYGIAVLRTLYPQTIPLVLNGLTEQLAMMAGAARELGAPAERLILIDCGPRGVGNTKTQLTALRADPRFATARHLTFVTSGQHLLRVARTAERQLPEATAYTVLPVPYADYPFNVFRIRAELHRILAYAEKGDVAPFLQRFG